jgi:HD-GYP domain-containing protein (c-di-GMP phosphodiesterase class II)
MELIEIPKDELFLGMSLEYTLRDASGMVLLTKARKIDTQQQLDAIRSRAHVYVDIDQTGGGVRAVMSSLSALDQAGAPIKDFSRYLNLKKSLQSEDKQVGSLAQRWGDVESKLGGLLASVETTEDFARRIGLLDRQMRQLLTEDANASQFLLFNRAVTHFGGYSVMHSLLCATLASLLADVFALTDAQRSSLVSAALTMNIAMTHLQDMLAVQKQAPSAGQRGLIDSHAAAGRKMLEQAGVTDQTWLMVVAMHHATITGPDDVMSWPAVKRMTKILQTVDRYTAAMSPRKSRAGRTARDSVRAVVVQAGEARHDEVGTALVKVLGLSPPGTFVKLANGETAVVVRRGIRPAQPLVASVLNRNDEPIAEPRLRDTAKTDFAVQSTLTATAVRVNLNVDLMLRLIPR